MTVKFFTLGCKVNQNETASLTRLFCENGFKLAEKGEAADVYIVNSCTVTNGGDKKSAQILRRAKRENPTAITVLTGCFPQAFEEKAAQITEADIVTGANKRKQLLNHVFTYLNNHERIIDIEPHKNAQIFEELPMPQKAGKTRGFIKIQDGCNRRCSYCIIPYARGPRRSRQEDAIIDEAKKLAGENCAEIVLTGINLSAYGQDTSTNVADIVEKIAQIPEVKNIRLGSLEPDLLTDEIIDKLAAEKKLCAQFHLALQSGCDKTLKAMNRLYTKEQFATVAKKIRAKLPHATLITDVIVGFPNESDEDFEESLNFVREMQFLKVHVFSYSRRKGTKAHDMEGQIDTQKKAQRSAAMQKAAEEVRAKIIGDMRGQAAEVLLETNVGGSVFTGYTREYVPVAVKASGYNSGDIVSVELEEYENDRCRARLIRG